MKKTRILRGLALVAILILVGTGMALASGMGYAIDWWSVDGGGGTSSGGTYILHGTIGQPDAGVIGGGTYTLIGGFWGRGYASGKYEVYLPLVVR